MKSLYSFVIVLLISGCSVGGKKVPDKIYYRFPEPVISTSNIPQFVVKRPTALSILGSRPMVAQNSTGGLLQMQHNLWLASPKILLQNYLIKIFENSSNSETLTEELNVQILHLEKKQEQALLELKFEINNKLGETTFSHTYREQTQLSSNSIPIFVKSIEDSLIIITQKFIDDLK